jgi:cold shock protein
VGIIFEETAYMMKGKVRWFDGTKGYGFIQPNDGSNDVFVHISAVQRAGMQGLNEGQKIALEVVPNPKTGRSSADKLQAM